MLKIVNILLGLIPVETNALPQELRHLRDQARTVVQKSHCAKCHAPELSPKPKAIKVFNLSERDWSSTMTDSNLDRLKWALTDAKPDEIKEMGGNPNQTKLSKSEIETLTRFVDAELKFRKSNPDHRFKEQQRQKNSALFQILDSANPNSLEDCPL